MFEYEIGGKLYIQKPLVLGQIRQLMNLLQGVVIPSNVDTLGIIAALGDRLPKAIAIAITPSVMAVKDKDIDSLASEIEFELSSEAVVLVIEDFFSCNPIASLLERLGGVAEKMAGQINKTGLKKSASSSAVETSQKETAFSGDTPLPNASLI